MSFIWLWRDTALNPSSPSQEFDVTWRPFDPQIQQLFTNNEISKSRKSKIKFKINQTEFEADMDRMTQRNITTGFSRRITVFLSDKKLYGLCINWRWFDVNNNCWISYPANLTSQIEVNFQKFTKFRQFKELVLKISNKDQITVDFENMSARRNKISTKVKREVISDMTNKIKEESHEIDTKHRIKAEPLISDENEVTTMPVRSLRKRKAAPVYYEANGSDGEIEKKKASKIVDEDFKEEKEVKTEEEEEKEVKTEEEEDEEVEEIEEMKPKSYSGRRSKTNTKAVKTKHYKSCGPIKEESQEKKSEVKTLKFKGDIPLDERFTEIFGTDYKVYKEDNLIYDCMLNQTNLQYNNNKFYLIQIMQSIRDKSYVVWMRWGRVGQTGQTTSFKCGSDLNEAKEIFCNKFWDKTRNEFGSDEPFQKCPGKYDNVEKDYSSNVPIENEDSEEVKAEEKVVVPSKLVKPIQELIEMICNVTEMENLLKEMKFDTKKAPLGKLSQKQINAGYAALKVIEDHLNRNDFGKTFVHANNDFYTRIPHDFGMKVPPMIRSLAMMREKMKLLEVLGEIEVAVKAMKQESEIVNAVDRQYDQFNCGIEVVDKEEQIVAVIEEYLQKNHAPTHDNYKLKLLEVFALKKESEIEKYKTSDNRMLLWHGSRITNWSGILSQGLRIAPPEAPVTGYMFGKGCYFSDCSSKSANYCYTTSNKNIGLLSLSEVSLGKCNELKQADYEADKLPDGKMSTKGVGKSEPDKEDWVTLEDGCVVPIGKLVNNVEPGKESEYSLLYNEYIVYHTAQVKLKYLVKVEFLYDDE